MDINNRIFSLLKEQGKSAKELSKYITVSESSISAWKNNNSYPSSKYIIGISEFLNVSIEYLFYGKETNNSTVLSSDEAELIMNYKELDSRGQHKVHTIIYEEIDRMENTNIGIATG